DTATALDLAKTQDIDLALVDIHLSDGPTGMTLGKDLGNDHRIGVIFMTANPGMVKQGISGTIGVLSKPVDERIVQCAVTYALDVRNGSVPNMAPPQLQLFERDLRA